MNPWVCGIAVPVYVVYQRVFVAIACVVVSWNGSLVAPVRLDRRRRPRGRVPMADRFVSGGSGGWALGSARRDHERIPGRGGGAVDGVRAFAPRGGKGR